MKEKEYCEKLIKRYKELYEKSVGLQDYIHEEAMKETLSPREKEEFEEVKRELKKGCLEFLPDKDKLNL